MPGASKEEPGNSLVDASSLKLSLNRSTYRACICACTAVDAKVSVDFVLAVTLCDSLNGTLSSASAASDAVISNLECHDIIPPYFYFMLLYCSILFL